MAEPRSIPRERPDVRPDLVAFAQVLRAAGLDLGTGQVVALAEAAAVLAPVDSTDLYWAARACLVNDPADLATFDQLFAAWFRGVPLPPGEAGVERPERVAAVSAQREEPAEAEEPGEEDAERAGGVASSREELRSRRFDELSREELAAMRRLMGRIDVWLPRRVSRRTRPSRRRGDLDLHRSLRRALQTEGELLDRRWRRRRRRPRRLVLLLDVSGSMAGFSRALLQFAFSARIHAGSVEVFAFGTRLTRLTEDLAHHDPDRALAAAAARVQDWHGGTRIGHAVETLNRAWGRRGTTRGAVVLICSDGLERDDPQLLGRAMARLHRSAHAVVWVNPLMGDPRYEPAARGMRAALPHVDRFVSGHDLGSLDDLADVVGELR